MNPVASELFHLPVTNWQMVKHLAAKDWQFNRGPLIAYLVVGLLAAAVLSIPHTTAFYVAAVLLISAVNIAGIHLVVTTVLHERKNQNLAFVMSLPVSYWEYTLAKMLVNIGVFLVFWLILSCSVLGVTLSFDSVNNGVLPFMIIALLELFIAFILLFAIAIVTESEAITVVFMTLASIGVSLFWHFTASVEAIGAQMQGDVIDWNSTVLTFIGIEILILLVALLGTLFMQSRKTDFL